MDGVLAWSEGTSPPSRGRGSKLGLRPVTASLRQGRPLRGGVDRNRTLMTRTAVASPVAPFAGAWIETADHHAADLLLVVAPFAGAWIETLSVTFRGPAPSRVAPFAGAWIETQRIGPRLTYGQSPPSRGRGSKHTTPIPPRKSHRSPPSRGRGSKHRDRGGAWGARVVAPFAGAWIETRRPD